MNNNVFSRGCPSNKHRSESLAGGLLYDIKYYPDDYVIVIEKRFQPDVEIDLSQIVSDLIKNDIRTNKPIKIKDEQTGEIIVIPQDTPITEAMQKVVDDISKNVETIPLWAEWE